MAESNPIEEALQRIEVGIRQLKTQYDMFFSGAMPRQPLELRKELETLLKVISDTRMQRFADRYRFNSLAAKYQSTVELWNKMIRAKEEGRLRPGVPGFVEPVRRIAGGSAATGAAATAAIAAPADPGRQARADRFVMGGQQEKDPSLRLFYDRFLEAKRGSGGETAAPVSFEQFSRQIRARTESIQKKAGCEAVTYSIVVKDGGVTLKANPAKGPEKGPAKGKEGNSR